MNLDLKRIKKYYGEKMWHLCRKLFPLLLEKEGVLSSVLLENFEPNHQLCDDILENDLSVSLKKYIYNLIDVENLFIDTKDSMETPKELMAKAGYDLFECKTEEEIQSFKKYYTIAEQLCTFDGGRLNECYVFFAVKKNVDDIKRENFKNPKREDEYGTSVISIQFTKDETHTLSIKNRYNHRVNNPDSTFSNNLDNIIEGLTKSFETYYGLKQKFKSDNFEIPGYVKANDGKLYKYHYEMNNIYYCPNNIIIDNFQVKRFEKEKYIVFDYFILDLKNKKMMLYDETIKDSFIQTVKDIDKIEITKEKENKKVTIVQKDSNVVEIELTKANKIDYLRNDKVEEIADDFLVTCNGIREIALPNAKRLGNNFLKKAAILQIFSLPNVEIIGDNFLYHNWNIEKVDLPNAKLIGDNCLYFNQRVAEMNVPHIEDIGNDLLFYNNNEVNFIFSVSSNKTL